jgi:hypothetical protein
MSRIIALFIAIMALSSTSVLAGEYDGPCKFPGYKGDSCLPDQGQDQDQDQDQDQEFGDKNPKPDLPQRPRPPHHGNPGHRPPHHGNPGHGNPGHPGHGFPGHGGNFGSLCSGGFEGFYMGQPFPVAFLVQDNGFGQLAVQSWFRGGSWFGQGVCRQINPFQAQFELYFPGAPVHRGVISRNQFGATIMEGQLDFHGPFQLQRTR